MLCHLCLFQPFAVPIAIIYKWACFHEFPKSAKQHGTATWKSSHVRLFKKRIKHVKTKTEKKGKHNLSCFGMFWTSKHQFSTIQCPFRAQQLPLGKPGDASLLLCSTILTQAGAVIGRNIVWQWQLLFCQWKEVTHRGKITMLTPGATSITCLGTAVWAIAFSSLLTPRWQLYNNLNFSPWACQDSNDLLQEAFCFQASS